MGGSGETGSQRNERLAAQTVSDAQKKKAADEKKAFEDTQAAAAKKKNELLKRKTGMQGGGRSGLMYKGREQGIV